MATSPKLFTCPKCRHTYLGHEPLPDCPRCGFDYREKEGFRWDILVYLLAILGLISFLLVSSYYRGFLGGSAPTSRSSTTLQGDMPEKMPGGERNASKTFRTPYHEPGP
ncbi:MAG: hypothetical protein ACT4OO_12480 [Nitrospiraceae bacterium]